MPRKTTRVRLDDRTVRSDTLFHHDPRHTSDDIDALLAEAQATDAASRLDGVLAAWEGLTIDLGRP